MATLSKSSVSNVISTALQRSIRTGKCTAVEFNSYLWSAYLTIKYEKENQRQEREGEDEGGGSGSGGWGVGGGGEGEREIKHEPLF